MMLEVVVVSIIVGAAIAPGLQWLRGKLSSKRKWEPFEPGMMCDELPLHQWGWSEGAPSEWSFWCPACLANAGTNQPPLCNERGGHFHFKCVDCGYKWAMRRADYIERP